MITICTATYNREKELKNLYESLLTQKDVDFEWLVIDDGSKDNTKKLINKWIKDGAISINYVYKENGGKPSAYNEGLLHAKGKIFSCIDSDDILIDNILKNVENDFKNLDKDCCGVSYLCNKMNSSEVIGTSFPNNVNKEYYYNIYNKLKVKGDKCMFLKTSIAKKYPFPIIEKEKFIPEALVFNRIAKKFKFKLINKSIICKEYLENGYSNNYFSLVKNNPKSNTMYFLEEYEFFPNLYNVYGYLLFSFFSNYKMIDIIKNHPAKIKIIFLYIPTKIISKIRR